jgi:hypothetical protein
MEDRPEGADDLPELRFGPLRMPAADVIAAFTDERELIRQLADEIAAARCKPADLPEAERTYRTMLRSAASAFLLSAATDAEEYARSVFEKLRVALDEARARAVVLQYARREKYTKAKELVVAAASFVRAQEVRRAVADERSDPNLLALGFGFAMWATATGLRHKAEVVHDPARATRARSEKKDRRVEDLRAAMDRGAVKPNAAAIVAWRGEKPTKTNRERARVDLRDALRLKKNVR